MAEELRIIVEDKGGALPTAPATPGTAPGTPTTPTPAAVSPEPAEETKAPRVIPSTPPPVSSPPVEGPKVPTAVTDFTQDLTATTSGPVTALSSIVDKVGLGLSAIGPAALVVTASFTAVAGAATAVAAVIGKAVDQIAGYSAEVAVAASQTALQREQAIVNRAERIGPSLAAAEQVRARFEAVTTEIWTSILETLLKILDRFEPLIDAALKMIELITWLSGEGLSAIVGTAIRAVFGTTPSLIAGSLGWLVSFFRRREEQQDENFKDPFLEMFLSGVPKQGPGAGGIPEAVFGGE